MKLDLKRTFKFKSSYVVTTQYFKISSKNPEGQFLGLPLITKNIHDTLSVKHSKNQCVDRFNICLLIWFFTAARGSCA